MPSPASASSARHPRLSFVVPLYNCLPLTQAMLASLERTLADRDDFEVILVDDGSTDGTRNWLRTLSAPYRVVLNEQNLGYARANNRGAQLARGEQLVLLNNDLVLRSGWLDPMLAVQQRLDQRVGLVGNVQVAVASGAIDHTGILIDAKGKPAHDRSRPFRSWLPSSLAWRQVPAVTGACLLVRREDFLGEGGFAEVFVNGGEDVDLALRFQRRGRINVVALRSVVGHHVSASPGRKRHDELNTYHLVRRWRPELIQHGLRAWTRAHLRRDWTSPREPTGALSAVRLLAYALHLRRRAPSEAIEGMNAALDNEITRWRTLFPEATTDEPAPQVAPRPSLGQDKFVTY